jgi:hypothetical protein
MTATLSRWLLDTIYDEWPDPMFPPTPPDGDAVVRIDRDEPRILATGERTRSVDLAVAATISAGTDDVSHTPEGTQPTYETEETATVRVASLHEQQGGTVAGHAGHRRLVDNVLGALDAVRSYPAVDLSNRSRQPTRLSIFVGGVQDSSSEYADHYETTIPVRLRGKLDPDS